MISIFLLFESAVLGSSDTRLMLLRLQLQCQLLHWIDAARHLLLTGLQQVLLVDGLLRGVETSAVLQLRKRELLLIRVVRAAATAVVGSGTVAAAARSIATAIAVIVGGGGGRECDGCDHGSRIRVGVGVGL